MVIKQIYDVEVIKPLHKEIFGTEFPICSYYKKRNTYDLYIYVYEEDCKFLGYSIIVDQADLQNLYAWYGGVLPEAQGNGITDNFFDKLIELARKKEYKSVTVASYNTRPHMLRFAIKKGFDIYDIKKRDYGSGNKIYFRYLIHPPSILEIDLIDSGRFIKPAEIEEKLVIAYKNNCEKLYFKGVDNYKTLEYAIIYCNSFSNRPEIIINVESTEKEKLSYLKNSYKGKITIE